jgi:D-alanyl-lipoteichoic acid acyltransferase DltB (MBOAT superfamily)
MPVNTLPFLVFFTIVFVLYYFLLKEKTKAQNILLLATSYVFYGIANLKMLPLLVMVTLVFYALGILTGKAQEKSARKASVLTALGICFGVGLLLYFKYLNFFIASFSTLFSLFGFHTQGMVFNSILPVGISFFTFKLISYVIEVHDRVMAPVTDLTAFAAYAAFFPALFAGPIDRPNTFMPQLQKKRVFDYALAVDGSRQIVWGMFKKMIIADKLAIAVDGVWNSIAGTPGVNLFVTAFLFSLQIYADFSGYSDMAIGVGKLLGFSMAKNFNYPFFARNIAEFWRNWHMSLTSWLTDYIFMPLHSKFRKAGKAGIIAAVIINFLLVGFWHGANWTFVLLGLYHGLLYIPLILSGGFGKTRKLIVTRAGLPAPKEFARMLATFTLVTFGMLIFRAGNVAQLRDYVVQRVTTFLPLSFSAIVAIQGKKAALAAFVIIALEWYSYRHKMEYALCAAVKLPVVLRYAVYVFLCLLLSVSLFGGDHQEFIYQQF